MCHKMFNDAAELARLHNKIALFMMILGKIGRQWQIFVLGEQYCWRRNNPSHLKSNWCVFSVISI